LPIENFYLPGATIKVTCPHCGEVWTINLDKDLEEPAVLNCPTVNKPFVYETSCDAPGVARGCGYPFAIELTIDISLSAKQIDI